MSKDELLIKITELNERIFYHEMKDHWTKEDFDLAEEMELELAILKEKLKNANNNK